MLGIHKSMSSAYEETSRFDSFISHLSEHIEIVKTLKGFGFLALPSKVMDILFLLLYSITYIFKEDRHPHFQTQST